MLRSSQFQILLHEMRFALRLPANVGFGFLLCLLTGQPAFEFHDRSALGEQLLPVGGPAVKKRRQLHFCSYLLRTLSGSSSTASASAKNGLSRLGGREVVALRSRKSCWARSP